MGSLIDFCGVCRGDNTDCFFSSLLGTGQVTAITAGVIAAIVVAAVVVALIAAYLSRKGYQYYKNVSDLNSAGAVQNPYFKDSEFGGNMVNPKKKKKKKKKFPFVKKKKKKKKKK